MGIEEANVSIEGASTQKDAVGEDVPDITMVPEEILPVPVLPKEQAAKDWSHDLTPGRNPERDSLNPEARESTTDMVPTTRNESDSRGGQTPQQRWRLKNKVKLALYSKERRRKIKEAKRNTKDAMGE